MTAKKLNTPEFLAEVDPMFSLLKKLNSQYFDDFSIATNHYLQIKFIAVDSAHSGNGIAAILLEQTLLTGKNKGFKFAQTESAGNKSQHIFREKLNFEVVGEILYRDFLYNGSKPFKAAPNHESMQLMLRKL